MSDSDDLVRQGWPGDLLSVASRSSGFGTSLLLYNEIEDQNSPYRYSNSLFTTISAVRHGCDDFPKFVRLTHRHLFDKYVMSRYMRLA